MLYQISHDEGRIINGEYEYEIKDHLGNLRVSFRDSLGIAKITQKQDYDIYGSELQGLSYTKALWNQDNFKYLGRESISQTGYIDLLNRQYDRILGRFVSTDPVTDGQESQSLYQYGWNNPVLRSDPNGLIPDDYFNKNGKYLGSDEAKTDNVKVIDQKVWNDNKTTDNKGKESISNQVGEANSQKFSEAKLDTKSALSVYQHYNTTDLKLKSSENKYPDGKLAGGMAFTIFASGNKLSQKYLAISVQGNYAKGIADHANQISNIFSHEGQHYQDFKTLGLTKYLSQPTSLLEQRAVITQINDPSFLQTSSHFQKVVDAYGKQFNYDPTKPAPPLK